MKIIAIIFGTRPEIIKLFPLYLELKKYPKEFIVKLISTGQHKEMLDQMLKVFSISPDVSLNIMKNNQTLSGLTSTLIQKLDQVFKKENFDLVIVQGDTTTTMAASLVAFYHKIKIAHIEAGLRTHDKTQPFPEEINRILTSHISDMHFTPTQLSKENLAKEGIDPLKIWVTGNTVVDTLLWAKNKVENEIKKYEKIYQKYLNKDLILVTGHRREHFDKALSSISEALIEIKEKYSNVNIIYPVHLNPNVRKIILNKLKGINGIYLIEPLDYFEFIYLMSKSKVILTDSGGIQEEAPSFNVPVLIFRKSTERPEAVLEGLSIITGYEKEDIVNKFIDVYENKRNKILKNPYGDGRACQYIVQYLRENV